MVICGKALSEEKDFGEIADEVIFSFEPDDNINFEERYIQRFLTLFRQTCLKLFVFLSKNNQEAGFLLGREGLKEGWQFLVNFCDDSESYRGSVGLSLFYYMKEGEYIENAQFLFGTAYQFTG